MKTACKGIAFIAILSILFYPYLLHASPVTDKVKSTIDGVINILKDPSLKGPENTDKRRSRIRGVMFDLFNFEEMAKRSLARHWKKRSDMERKEFVAIFTDLIEGSYIEKIEAYTNEEILYTGEKIDGRRAVVKTRIISKGAEIPIHYRLLESKDGSNWMVYDIVIEGVSLIGNYRTQFNKIIRRASYEELVKRVKAKLEKR